MHEECEAAVIQLQREMAADEKDNSGSTPGSSTAGPELVMHVPIFSFMLRLFCVGQPLFNLTVNRGQYVAGVALLEPHHPGFQKQLAIMNGAGSVETLQDTQREEPGTSPLPPLALFQTPVPSEAATMQLAGKPRPVATAQTCQALPDAEGTPPPKTSTPPPLSLSPTPNKNVSQEQVQATQDNEREVEEQTGQEDASEDMQEPCGHPNNSAEEALQTSQQGAINSKPEQAMPPVEVEAPATNPIHHQRNLSRMAVAAAKKKAATPYKDGTYWRTVCLHLHGKVDHACQST